MMGCDVDVQPNSIDLDAMRKMIHTPKDGVLLPQDTKYYIANLRQNEFLRKFINDYDSNLQPQIDKQIKPNLQKPLKGFLLSHSPIRQARKNLTIMEKQEKRMGSLMKVSPVKV